ncbi:MAG TPA: neutral/alkaline non-lysosomal ceramidase N-terminal domain-containing protein, partial [Planctomycetaceae bacterium]
MQFFNSPQSRCRLGFARCDITPPVGIYHRMWGAATHDRAAGIHRPLTADAVIFQPLEQPVSIDPEESEQILLAVDHCLLWYREMQALLEAVAEQAQVNREKLLVVFSHTHSAGLMDLDRQQLPGGELIGQYLATLACKLTEAVCAARASLRPTTMMYGVGACSLAANRDFRDAESGKYVCGFNPDGIADDSLLVVRATDDDGVTLATFVNYACHPTTLAWENQLISPDFPGAMRELVEQATHAPCIFLQGASGDLGPREGFSGDPALADRNGRQLGYAALSALEALPPAGTRYEYAGPVVSGATLGVWQHKALAADQAAAKSHWRLARWTVNLPYRPELPTSDAVLAARARFEAARQKAEQTSDPALARDAHAMIERMDRQLTRLAALPTGPDIPLPVWLWEIGDAVWLAVEAEHYQMLQRKLRDRFPGVPIVVMTLANGSRPSYLPTAEVYDTGVYPETIAVLARGSLEKLIEAIGEK